MLGGIIIFLYSLLTSKKSNNNPFLPNHLHGTIITCSKHRSRECVVRVYIGKKKKSPFFRQILASCSVVVFRSRAEDFFAAPLSTSVDFQVTLTRWQQQQQPTWAWIELTSNWPIILCQERFRHSYLFCRPPFFYQFGVASGVVMVPGLKTGLCLYFIFCFFR